MGTERRSAVEIRRPPPADVPDLLRRVPGPRFEDRGVHGNALYVRARGPGGRDGAPPGFCRPRIYVDGSLLDNRPRHGTEDEPGLEVAVEELVPVDDVVAVEIYSGGATVPPQWGGSQGTCGVVLFWTEVGR